MMLALPFEIWKDIPRYIWLYKVSNMWNVMSIWKRNYLWSRWRINKWRNIRTLKHRFTLWYPQVCLWKEWSWKQFKVHRLVAQSFLWLNIEFLDPKSSLCVCHKDDNPSNCKLSNLFLWTNKDNNIDMHSKWRRKYQIWTKVHNSKYSSEDIKNIRTMFNSWVQQKQIAIYYHTTQQHISLICREKIYKDV